MRNIKVWGGTHPNEPLGMEVVASLGEDSIENVDAGIANIRGQKLGRRFVDINLNDGYPGNANSAIYEERRAVEILQQSLGYFAVADIHAMHAGGEESDYAAIGKYGVSPEVYGFFAKLGMSNIVQLEFNALI